MLERKSAKFDIALGRQSLVLDDQRFIGNVGWRQNEQTYDGVVLRWRPISKTEVTIGWLRNVNRINGPNQGVQAAYWHGNSYVVNARREFGSFGTAAI